MGIYVVKFGISRIGIADLGFLSGILSLLTILRDTGLILEVRQNIRVVCLATHDLRRR